MSKEIVKNKEGEKAKNVQNIEAKEKKPSYKERIIKKIKGVTETDKEVKKENKVEQEKPKDEVDELIRRMDDKNIKLFKDQVPQNLEDVIKVMGRLRDQEKTKEGGKNKESFENTEMAKKAITAIDLLLFSKHDSRGTFKDGTYGEKGEQIALYGPKEEFEKIRDTIGYDLRILDQYMGGDLQELMPRLEEDCKVVKRKQGRYHFNDYSVNDETRVLQEIRERISTYSERQNTKEKFYQELKNLGDPTEQVKNFCKLQGYEGSKFDDMVKHHEKEKTWKEEYFKESLVKNLKDEYLKNVVKIAGSEKSTEKKMQELKDLEALKDIKIGTITSKTDIESFRPIKIEGLSKKDAVEVAFKQKKGFKEELKEYDNYVEDFKEKERDAVKERSDKMAIIFDLMDTDNRFRKEIKELLDEKNIDLIMKKTKEYTEEIETQKKRLREKLDLEEFITIEDGQTETEAMEIAVDKYMNKRYEKLSRDKNYVLNVNKSYSDAKEYYKRLEQAQ